MFSRQYNCERSANYNGGSEAGPCGAGQITSWLLWREGRKIPSFRILQIRVVRFKPILWLRLLDRRSPNRLLQACAESERVRIPSEELQSGGCRHPETLPSGKAWEAPHSLRRAQ